MVRGGSSSLKPSPILAAIYLCFPLDFAAAEPFLTRLGCSIKDGSPICEFLLREDDEALGRFVRQGLEGEQYSVDVFKDGEQAKIGRHRIGV